jgi:DNA-binding response OmpR family regulator
MMLIPQTKVLNVDDEEAPRYVKTRDLQASGFAVSEARSGAEALQAVEREKPAVVLLDVQLPDISGPDVCAYIKRRWPEVMVLMTSATFTSAEDRTFGLDSGADSYLLQPADPLELRAAVNSLLRIRRTEDDLRSLNITLEKKIQDRMAELVTANSSLREEIEQRRKAEAALVQSQKMEAVGQLTGGLAHDFNNLLTAVIANFELIKMRAGDPKTVTRLAENGMIAANRGAKLTAQLLAFSRVQQLDQSPVDVNELIEGMTPLLSQTLGPTVEIRRLLSPDLPPAIADGNQLELAILNLAINARDAMAKGGSISLSTFPDPQNGDRIVISVEDSGSGMPPDVLARAFDPFFTTKPPGKGTGLGLSQVFGVARQLGGDVTIRSEVGKGTDVRMWLRRSAVAPAPTLTEEQVFASSKSERVLIVDDDDDVRRVLADVLSAAGYRVRDFSAGAEALEALDGFQPELMIIDYAMPGRNGAELAQHMRERIGDIPVLFVTGYANDAALHALGDRTPILRKPFRPAELAAKVRSTLDARAQK